VDIRPEHWSPLSTGLPTASTAIFKGAMIRGLWGKKKKQELTSSLIKKQIQSITSALGRQKLEDHEFKTSVGELVR
jgi:hypothetical protein